MKIANIDFPGRLLTALRDGKLVVFAGAGVSMGQPANLPNFEGLARKIAAATGKTLDEKESPERFLGRLEHQGVKVHERAVQILSGRSPEPTGLHKDILGLYVQGHPVRIVTTNFDTLFEQATCGALEPDPEIYRAPALPLGYEFEGIVHVHGDVGFRQRLVLTEADFGRAYLTEGWARRFLVDVFRSFAVVFIGYSHDDVIMNYLTRALPASETKPRFALTTEAAASRWKMMGIEPIVFPQSPPNDYSQLHQGIQKLACHMQRSVLEMLSRSLYWPRLYTTFPHNIRRYASGSERVATQIFQALDGRQLSRTNRTDTPKKSM